jgi:hypothetical protein
MDHQKEFESYFLEEAKRAVDTKYHFSSLQICSNELTILIF